MGSTRTTPQNQSEKLLKKYGRYGNMKNSLLSGKENRSVSETIIVLKAYFLALK